MRVPFPGWILLMCLVSAPFTIAQQITEFTVQQATEPPTDRKSVSITATLVPELPYIVEESPDLTEWNQISSIVRTDGSFDWSYTQTWVGPDLYNNGTSNWNQRRFYRLREIPPGNPRPFSNGAAVAQAGRLTLTSNGLYQVLTQSNWKILIKATTLTITNPSGRDTYEMWGSGSGGTGHESLNGKHIKDNFGGARTILLPDGTIITVALSTTPGSNTIASFSIYDNDQSHRLTSYPDGAGNPNTVVMSVPLRRAGEAEEADGETCRLLDTPQGMYFENIYIQNNADGLPVPVQSVPLGKTGGPSNPNQVNDYYDDPRISYT